MSVTPFLRKTSGRRPDTRSSGMNSLQTEDGGVGSGLEGRPTACGRTVVRRTGVAPVGAWSGVATESDGEVRRRAGVVGGRGVVPGWESEVKGEVISWP